ncbi:unnamed protein product [Rotaria socialis]|uniref:MI domain-containing protein n=1 Tax=Rotaria socialis TaxID=392032 RepID=A0A818X270_9BILA|nr:unnamed protein product [Rotaria socialis]CAF3643403.1 unnamed protein product [Rotaria socialis]CAF3734378.1 unnamed protein product [Rotaria socialis]CAF4470378.1 unnamed protein product [Rotaria socialis]CAF4768270.1 unnamed protein product [Rotaria socialis]
MKTNLPAFFRTIFLAIELNSGAEKCARKLLKMNASLGQETEICQIIIDNCAQRRRYEPFLGLLGQRLCLLKSEYAECFEKAFHDCADIDGTLR